MPAWFSCVGWGQAVAAKPAPVAFREPQPTQENTMLSEKKKLEQLGHRCNVRIRELEAQLRWQHRIVEVVGAAPKKVRDYNRGVCAKRIADMDRELARVVRQRQALREQWVAAQ
jgi:hypothetical protein